MRLYLKLYPLYLIFTAWIILFSISINFAQAQYDGGYQADDGGFGFSDGSYSDGGYGGSDGSYSDGTYGDGTYVSTTRPRITSYLPGCDTVTNTPRVDLTWSGSGPNTPELYELWRDNGVLRTVGNGLFGRYFNEENLTSSVLTRTDPQINFNWGAGSPDSGIGSETFSIRWTGSIKPRHSTGTSKYRLFVNVNDGARLYVNGTRMINKWQNRSSAKEFYTSNFTMTADNYYSIRLEFLGHNGDAQISLSWAEMVDGNEVNKELIPQANLFSSKYINTPLSLSLPPNQFSYTDLGATDPSLQYRYRIVSIGPDGRLTTSSSFKYGPNCGQPVINSTTFPACLNGVDPQVQVGWLDINTPDRYEVWRGVTDPNILPVKVGQTTDGTVKSFIDNNLNNPLNPPQVGVSYWYQIVPIYQGLAGTSSQKVFTPSAIPPCSGVNPVISFNFLSPGCYTPLTWNNPPITVAASATSPRTVASVTFSLTENSSTPVTNQYTTLTPTPAGSNNYQLNLTKTQLETAFGLAPKKFSVSATVTDNNTPTPNTDTTNSPINFDYLPSCTKPWIQTTGGDVHSNTEINLPGGP